MTTWERLQQIVEERVGTDINDTQTPEQVGLDSLDTAELLADLSDEFKVDLPFTEIAFESSFGSWAKVIDAKLEAAQEGGPRSTN